ncbi:ferric-chelate reductase 1 [Plakobranchus ocellatus]|uniref:Ferric-chelate reductase 1 n=1 Tax=Plakobranchus ocellatus TaxID=259542 RepID=A0AAV3XTI0_9GAST|nr:ferric-chelate reductase 1 [Plakobranchus ocellatus]
MLLLFPEYLVIINVVFKEGKRRNKRRTKYFVLEKIPLKEKLVPLSLRKEEFRKVSSARIKVVNSKDNRQQYNMKALRIWAGITICIFRVSPLVSSFPTGAPLNACMTLDPSSSHGSSTAKDPSPYKLIFSSSTYQPDQLIRVTLSGAMFKGFLIVGRKDGDATKANVGLFQSPTTPDAKLLCTGLKEGNGVTHTNNTVKSSITFAWKAPNISMGDIVFHFTVVRGGAPSVDQNPSDYYMDLMSTPLKPAPKISNEVILFNQEANGVTVVEVANNEEEEVVYAVPSSKIYPSA